jgi:translation initiation factor 2B subunit (eIF-2B alpha/beta/delta family)
VSAVSPGVRAERAADFARLIEVTRTLKRDFESAQWSGFAELEVERRAILERVFDEAPTAAELPALTAALREVVRLNDELIGLAEHRRRALGRELDLTVRGQRAGHLYRSLGTLDLGRRP